MLELISASLLWAASFGLIKDRLAGVDPDLAAFLRLSVAAVAFLPWLRTRTPRAGALAALGALQFGAMYALYFRSFRTLEAHEVVLMTVTTPLWVALLLRGGARAWAAALLAVAAGLVIVGGRPAGAIAGVLWIQAANLCFAFGQVVYRRWSPERHVESMAWMLVGATVGAGGIWWIGGGQGTIEVGQVWVIAYLGLVPSAVCFWLWNRGAVRVAAGTLAAANNLKVPLGVLVSILVFGEQARVLPLVGGSVLLVGAFGVARARHRDPTKGPPPAVSVRVAAAPYGGEGGGDADGASRGRRGG